MILFCVICFPPRTVCEISTCTKYVILVKKDIIIIIIISAAYREIEIKLFCIVVYMALAQNWTSQGFL